MAASSPSWSRLDPEARRHQIVEAAIGLFGRRPYDAVSMSEVARSAGVTRGLVHHYFPGKRDLYRAVLAALLASLPTLVRTDLDLDIEEVVAANAGATLAFLENNRETMLVVAQPGSLAQDPQLAEIVDQARETLVDRMLLNHLGTADVAPEVRLVIRGYLGLFEAVAREWLVRSRTTREEAHALLTRSLIVMMRDALPALSGGGLERAASRR